MKPNRLTRKEVGVLALYSIAIGVIVGSINAIFGRGIILVTRIRLQYAWWLLALLPLAGMLIVWLYRTYGGESRRGMGLVYEVGQGKRSKIPKRLVPLAIVTTWITHLFGGSVGREGVAVQIGSTVGNFFSRHTNIKDRNRLFLIIGIAAGFSGLFHTIWAAAFFAVEILIAGHIAYRAFPFALLSSWFATMTSNFIGLETYQPHLRESLDWSAGNILNLIILGLAFGVCGNLFAYFLASFKKWAQKGPVNPYLRIFLQASILALFLILLWKGRYAGLGTNLVDAAMGQEHLYAWDWILKMLLTAFSVGIGFQGGEVTPLFAMGAALGGLLGMIIGIPVPLAAALGYAAVFGAGTNTFLAPMIIGIEIFGLAYIPHFILVCGLASLLYRKLSIYKEQEIAKTSYLPFTF